MLLLMNGELKHLINSAKIQPTALMVDSSSAEGEPVKNSPPELWSNWPARGALHSNITFTGSLAERCVHSGGLG